MWAAQQQNRPDQWAKMEFEREAQRIPQSGFNIRRLQRPLQWLLWLPLNLGRLARYIGVTLDDMGNLITGAVILFVLVLVVRKIVPFDELVKRIKDVLGG